MRSISMWLGIVPVLALLLAGCSAPPAPTEPTVARVHAETAEAYDRLWNAVGDALRSHSFRVDREDRLAGVITTYPETAGQFFELWRPQSDSAYYWAEANLQTILLEAKVNILPATQHSPGTRAGAYDLDVQVNRMRYGLEERQIDNSAGAMRLFSADAPTVSGRLEKPAEHAQTIPLGRDKPAEERLVQAMLSQYAKAPAVLEPVRTEPVGGNEQATTRPE